MRPTRFEEFLSKVTSKVKAKDAHAIIKKELTNHLHELSLTFQKRGATKEEAEEKAIQEMGNPFTIGENLNRLHKPKVDWILVILFIIIAGISFLPLIGGVPNFRNFVSVSDSYLIKRQAIWLTLAVLVLISFVFFDYRKLQSWWAYFYGGGLLLLLSTQFFGLMKNCATRWLALPGITFDGIAFSLFFFFLAGAGILLKVNEFEGWKKKGVLFLLFWIPLLLYFSFSHIMISIIYFFCILMMFVFSHIPKKSAMKVVVANSLIAVISIGMIVMNSKKGYLYDRLGAFVNPDKDPNGAGYMYLLVQDILSEAGWFGKGLDAELRLPAAHTDFVFPYLVHLLGWAFGITLCFILLVFILRITFQAFQTKDLFGRLLVIGGATLFIVPTCWNILMGFRIVPIMAVSLPFISYGGTMLLFYSALLGLILNVYRRK